MRCQTNLEERQSWIDVLKGIGILFVVIGHVCLNKRISNWIYSFHMPLFFFLSGYLWSYSINKHTPFFEFLRKRTVTILIPFILFRIALVIYWIIVESHFRALDLGPIWFLVVLYISEIAGYVLLFKRESRFLNEGICLILCITLFILKVLSCDESIYGAWIMRIINGLMWYLLGHLIGLLIRKYHITFHYVVKVMMVCGFLIFSIFISLENGSVSMWSSVFGNYFLYIIGSISGIAGILLFCKWFYSSNRTFEYFGQYTIIILATHEPIKRIILKGVESVTKGIGIGIPVDTIQNNLILSAFVVLLILLAEVILIHVFKILKSHAKGITSEILTFVKA